MANNAENLPETEAKLDLKGSKIPVKVANPIFRDFRNTVDGRIWGSLTSQGKQIPTCSKCGSKRLCESAEVNAGVMVAKLRCPNEDPNCSFVQSYVPNKSPYS
jgi:hypothetical protein